MNRELITAAEMALIENDLSSMDEASRVALVTKVCESMGLNPLTQPFQFVWLNGRLTLYATKNATEQLRAIHDVSCVPEDVRKIDGLLVCKAVATMPNGRTDASIGVVTPGKTPTDHANQMMKCETKAKRRATLSICGLGFISDSEFDTVEHSFPEKTQRKRGQVPAPEEVKKVLTAQPEPVATVVIEEKPEPVSTPIPEGRASRKKVMEAVRHFNKLGVDDEAICRKVGVGSIDDIKGKQLEQLRGCYTLCSQGVNPDEVFGVSCSLGQDIPPIPTGGLPTKAEAQ